MSRITVRFCVPSDLLEGQGSRGPKPRGWRIRFYEQFKERGRDECWEWVGERIQQSGYGVLSIANVYYLAHRLSFVLANGKIDPDLLVMHSCDNRRCVNPKHLSQGTDKDNIQDALRKGRMLKGEKNGMSKLTEEKVVEIRRLHRFGETVTDLADTYKVHPPCISRIVKRHRWKHIP